MGSDIYEAYNEAKLTYEEVNDALKINLSDIIFKGDTSDINLTKNTQPAIMATGVAIFRVLQKNHNFKIEDFSFCAGHSLGEYTALVCAESFTLTDAAKILRARGEAMQNAVVSGEGSMAAVLGAEIEEIELIIKENKLSSVEISNDNCPGQIVISGKKFEVENCLIAIKKKISKKSIPLSVSAPFHCQLMKPAAEEIEDLIMNCNLKDPIIPIVSNVTAKVVKDKEIIKKLLVKQIYKRVRWREVIEYMFINSIKDFVEVGPGKSLSGMLKRFRKEILIKNFNNMEDLKL
jgi:[acyl-carrier-protein] S-malonyltransferase